MPCAPKGQQSLPPSTLSLTPCTPTGQHCPPRLSVSHHVPQYDSSHCPPQLTHALCPHMPAVITPSDSLCHAPCLIRTAVTSPSTLSLSLMHCTSKNNSHSLQQASACFQSFHSVTQRVEGGSDCWLLGAQGVRERVKRGGEH